MERSGEAFFLKQLLTLNKHIVELKVCFELIEVWLIIRTGNGFLSMMVSSSLGVLCKISPYSRIDFFLRVKAVQLQPG